MPASELASELTPSWMSPSEAMHQMVWSKTLCPGRRLRVEQAALAAGGHRHADRVADALAQRPGGGLDAGGVPVLGVAGGQAAPGAQRRQVVELEQTGEEELDVEGEAGVPGGEHEPVAADPVRVGRVVPHDPLEEQVGRRRQAHRRAGVAVADLLDGVHGQGADRVDGPAVERRSTPAALLPSSSPGHSPVDSPLKVLCPHLREPTVIGPTRRGRPGRPAQPGPGSGGGRYSGVTRVGAGQTSRQAPHKLP